MRVLAALVGLIAAAAGAAFLAWLLWRLWSDEEEAAGEGIEIEVPEAPLAAEPKDRAVAAPAELEAEVEKEQPQPAAAEVRPPAKADDLKVIEGIGPKISQVLGEAGIVTFGQLAEADAKQIEAILEAADPRLGRLANPGTWPDQAALAAEGKWEALADLQNTLKGGRKA